MPKTSKIAQASLESMYRVFTVPEAPDSKLGQLDKMISENLTGFLQEHIVAVEKDLSEMQRDFAESRIPEDPVFVSEQVQFLMDKLVAQSVHTASPSFIGHMTTALPYFMFPLSKIMIALNQNQVKTETSKAFTPLERQVIGMIHNLVYQQDESFYHANLHNSNVALGSMCSGGTIANITALWVARNKSFPADGNFPGIRRAGMFKALKHYGYEDTAILVSQRGHYSLSKSSDILGIGSDNIISIPTTSENKIDIQQLRQKCLELKHNKVHIMAIVGIAGTTETGNVDDLDAIANVATEFNTHFHVDAAWGGPTLFSNNYKGLLKGIERADSVTFDAHKQLYIPMGAGLVVFKDPATPNAIEHHAQYIIRKGSRDLGSKTLEGSRPGMAMLIHSGLRILGRRGYEILIDQGIQKAKTFAHMIEQEPDFELVSKPELNILTYRYCPKWIREELIHADESHSAAINGLISRITKTIQKTQRARGKSFVSRTKLTPAIYNGEPCIVFRVVLANPLTDKAILQAVLDEQKSIATESKTLGLLNEIKQLCVQSNQHAALA